MTTTLPPLAEAYVLSTNNRNPAGFIGLFADDAVVDDNGRKIHGLDAIKEWSDREIFGAQVTIEVLGCGVSDGQVVITAKVDGNFDRTGLPDPVIINHHISAEGEKITRLTCRLAGGAPAA